MAAIRSQTAISPANRAPTLADARGEGRTALPAERTLLEDVRRVLRRPAGWRVLVLHLSRLPERKAHHGRIARALLEEAAPRFDGQIHGLGNGDLVFFCREEAGTLRGVTMVLARLFPETLISLWPLESEALTLVAYAAGRLAEAVAPAERIAAPTSTTSPASEPAQDAAISSEWPDFGALMRRETAIRLAHGRMTLAFRDWRADSTYLSAVAGADPALLRHHLGALERDLLATLHAGAGTGMPLDPVPHRAIHPAWPDQLPPALHLHLSPASVFTDEFAHLAALCRGGGVDLGVAIAFSDACIDAKTMERARAAIAEAGALFVLDEVRAETFSCAAPAKLDPDLLVIDYGPALADLSAHDCARLFHPLEGAQVVLRGADDEAALAFGLARGISLFQGRHAAAMAAAARMFTCPSARQCTLAACMTRAAAASPEGRFGCAEPALLDGATAQRGPSSGLGG